jgi:tetrahydromethanopterin S-methyltransferase subunit H
MLMFRFKASQVRFTVGDIVFGGEGENPTVLIGSLFHKGHKVFIDEVSDEVNMDAVERSVKIVEELSDEYGVQHMFAVSGLTGESLWRHVCIISRITEAPLLLDGVTVKARVECLKYIVESGMQDRIVYNTISPQTGDEELEAIRSSGVKAAVLLTLDPRKIWPQERLDVIKGYNGFEGLLSKARRAGIDKTLIDATVLDPPSIALTAESILHIKNELGLPSGAAPFNAMYTWRKIREKPKDIFRACNSSVNTYLRIHGADFIIYGPVEAGEYIIPSIAIIDALLGYSLKRRNIPISSRHPLNKVFRNKQHRCRELT